MRALAIATNHNIEISIADLTYILYEKIFKIYYLFLIICTSMSLGQIEPIDYTDTILINYDPEYQITDIDDKLIEN